MAEHRDPNDPISLASRALSRELAGTAWEGERLAVLENMEAALVEYAWAIVLECRRSAVRPGERVIFPTL